MTKCLDACAIQSSSTYLGRLARRWVHPSEVDRNPSQVSGVRGTARTGRKILGSSHLSELELYFARKLARKLHHCLEIYSMSYKKA